MNCDSFRMAVGKEQRMASDDMFVIMYKIIAYIYQCMKDGMPPEKARYSADSLGIPDSYWKYIMSQLVTHGYLEGVLATKTASGTIVVIPDDPKVTVEGVQFAKENSAMAKAKKFLMDTKASVPFI
jgi:hypothetical protein